jgi:hypothetical protein
MSAELIKYAFSGGEVSPTFYGRTDLEKYDLGLALAYNWFVDYRGGLSTRQGTEFCDFVWRDDQPTKYFEFRFSPDLSNTYCVLFGHNYIRFIQDGAYVLEDAQAITAMTRANPGVFVVPSHGYSVGDWVKLNIPQYPTLHGRTFEVASTTTNNLTFKSVPDLTLVSTVGFDLIEPGATVARIYTVPTVYPGSALENLRGYQIRDLIRLTRPESLVRNLIRLDHADWVLEEETIGNNYPRPVITDVLPSTAGTAEVMFIVTAIMPDGSETAPSFPGIEIASVDYTTTAGYVVVVWDVVPNAVSYNVYRSRVYNASGAIHKGVEVGYIGRTSGVTFTDNNIVPDFTKAPPNFNDPFAAGAIENINVTGGGSGYDRITSTVSVSGGAGTGFIGYPIVSNSQVTGIKIINGGRNYTLPITVTVTVGTGATFTADVRPLTGVYPSISAVFQQRQVYAATENDPLTIWGSQIKRYSNFDYGDLVLDSDSYEHELDAAEISPILHMRASRGGLLLMTQTGIWILSGGGGPVTPTNALAEPQTATGVSPVPPLPVGTDLLYIEGKGSTVRLLSYNEFSKVYSGEDRSILSNHLFGGIKDISSWAFADTPFKVVWSARGDGRFLGFTLLKEQDVYAWTQHATKGYVLDVINIQEEKVDRVYMMTQRFINGRWTKMIERMARRTFDHVEDAWCVDSGLSLGGATRASALNVDVGTGEAVFTATVPLFTSADAGRVLRGWGGKAIINTFVNATTLEGVWVRDPTEFVPETEIFPELAEGEWTLDTPITVINGLHHLEGETVSILGDGNVFPQQTVVNGALTLPDGVTRAIIGLPYRCIAKTLPPVAPGEVIESRRKRVPGVAVRMNESRGLTVGLELDNLYPFRERTYELMGQPTEVFDGIKYLMLPTDWEENAQLYFVQEDPLPSTILGLVLDLEIGDDTN